MCEVEATFTVALPKSKNDQMKSSTVASTKRSKSVMMSFVDKLWSMEVSGGSDQFSPLTVIAVKKNGLARRAGIKVGDIITHINARPTDRMTLIDAQLEIQESGRSLKLIVKGYDILSSRKGQYTQKKHIELMFHSLNLIFLNINFLRKCVQLSPTV